MMDMKKTLLVAGILAAIPLGSANAGIIGFEAENGNSVTTTVTASLGADFDPPLNDAGALGGAFITSETNFTDVGTTSEPGSAARVASYDVTFAEAGTYDLYARVFVGPGTGDDDSFFYGNGFGSKSATTGTDWITVNGISVFEGFPGETYFWINLSENSGDFGETPVTFTASAGVETFQVGGREDGLRFDAFAFGTTGDTFTDAELDASVVPEPASIALLGLGGLMMLRIRGRRRN